MRRRGETRGFLRRADRARSRGRNERCRRQGATQQGYEVSDPFVTPRSLAIFICRSLLIIISKFNGNLRGMSVRASLSRDSRKTDANQTGDVSKRGQVVNNRKRRAFIL